MTFVSQLISAFVTIVILGILIKRMIGRDVPERIGNEVILVSCVLGAIAMIVSGTAASMIMVALKSRGMSSFGGTPIFNSIANAFVLAAFPEEFIKLLFIIATLAIFKKKVKNVYEFIIIGAVVGFGFSVAENYSYGADPSALPVRIPMIAGHLVYNMIMGYFLGLARYNKIRTKKSQIGKYLLAFLIPTIAHTLYDAVTAFTPALSPDATPQIRTIGLVGAGIIVPLTIALQIFVLVRCRMDAENLCSMVIHD